MAETPTPPDDLREAVPVSVLTGFLGSGKTTLLNRLVHDPALAGALVLINEFGEIGLDHHLVEKIDANLVVMASGCLCCTIQSDLSRTLNEMAVGRLRGTVPAFSRVVIETTGLADPAPILHTLMDHPRIAAAYRLDGVIATVDAAIGARTLDAQIEAVKQVAMADRLVLTKADLAPETQAAALTARLRALNPGAPILPAASVTADALFNAGLYDPTTKTLDVQSWLKAEAYRQVKVADHAHGHHDHHDHDHDHDHDHNHHHDHAHDPNRHDARITAVCLTHDRPMAWDNFALWAQSLASYRGEDLLRLKAIVDIEGRAGPVAVHAVHHLFHPPAELPAWPGAERISRIVVIGRDLDPAMLTDSLQRCLAAGRPQ